MVIAAVKNEWEGTLEEALSGRPLGKPVPGEVVEPQIEGTVDAFVPPIGLKVERQGNNYIFHPALEVPLTRETLQQYKEFHERIGGKYIDALDAFDASGPEEQDAFTDILGDLDEKDRTTVINNSHHLNMLKSTGNVFKNSADIICAMLQGALPEVYAPADGIVYGGMNMQGGFDLRYEEKSVLQARVITSVPIITPTKWDNGFPQRPEVQEVNVLGRVVLYESHYGSDHIDRMKHFLATPVAYALLLQKELSVEYAQKYIPVTADEDRLLNRTLVVIPDPTQERMRQAIVHAREVTQFLDSFFREEDLTSLYEPLLNALEMKRIYDSAAQDHGRLGTRVTSLLAYAGKEEAFPFPLTGEELDSAIREHLRDANERLVAMREKFPGSLRELMEV